MTAVKAGEIVRPPLTITVKLEDDAEKTIKMSYGLFQDLQRTVPDALAIVDLIGSDPYTREYILRRCMTDSKKILSELDQLTPAEDIGLDDPDEMTRLLNWVAGHLLYFFATSAGGLKQLSEAFKMKLAPDQPAPSTNGSPD